MTLREFFENENIEYFAACPIGEATIINPGKLERACKGLEPDTAIVFIAPYYRGKEKTGNISRYAMARDYHIYFSELFDRLVERCEVKAIGFSDNSPIAEVGLAARLGLGVIGENGLLINEKYGSYIFIGEILCEGDPGLGLTEPNEARGCIGCGRCRKCCPTGALCGDMERCLSGISQKKRISPEEEKLLEENGCLWGCDVCQEACPMNERAAATPIGFFTDDIIENLDRAVLGEKENFARLSDRAFAWRGYDILKRNLDILEKRNLSVKK